MTTRGADLQTAIVRLKAAIEAQEKACEVANAKLAREHAVLDGLNRALTAVKGNTTDDRPV